MRTHAPRASARSTLLLFLLLAALAATVAYARLLLAPAAPEACAPERAPTHADVPAPAQAPTVKEQDYDARRLVILRALEARILARDYAAAQRLFEQYAPAAAKDVVFAALLEDFEKKKTAAQEEQLLAESAKLSARDMDKGLELYAALAALAPDNAQYAERLGHFRRARLERDLRRIDAYLADPERTQADHAIMLELARDRQAEVPEDPRLSEVMERLQRDALLFPQGNGRMETALEDEGQVNGTRAIYIWIYNVGDAPLDLAALAVSLETEAGTAVAASQNPLPADLLAPQAHAHGRFAFPSLEPPVRLVVRHPQAGTVIRRFR